MKTSITSHQGLVTDQSGDGIMIEGRDHHEAPFDLRWDDLSAVISEGTGPASLTYEAYRDTGFFMRFFRHNQNDSIFMTYQLPHGWDPSTAVRPHMHALPAAAGSGTVNFNYSYSWLGVNSGTLGNGSSWTTGSISLSIETTDQYKQKIVSFGSITPPSGASESICYFLKLREILAQLTHTLQVKIMVQLLLILVFYSSICITKRLKLEQ